MVAGGGSYQPGVSVESSLLGQLDAGKQSFANRDFVKNIAWLNESVTTLGQYTEKLQQGVDQANGDIFSTINDMIAEIVIMFAGGSPTGFEWNDLKYLFQGWGAMMGINPGTPYPLNIAQAIEYQFTTWLAPSEQFTDVLFDAQNAWAEELGLSPEFIQALKDYQAAIQAINATNQADFYQQIHDLLELIQPQDPASAQLWANLNDMFNTFLFPDTQALKDIFAQWADLGIPFLDQLTEWTNQENSWLHPGDTISAGQIDTLSANVAPTPSNNTATWAVGSNQIFAWTFDGTTPTPSFTTLGVGQQKRVLTERIISCLPNQTLVCDALVDWAGVNSAQYDYGMVLVYYQGATEKSSVYIPVANGHSNNGNGVAVHQETVVPGAVDGVRIGAYIGSTVTAGQVWVRSLSTKVSGQIHINQIAQLQEQLNNQVPWDVWYESLQIPVGDNAALQAWITSVMNADSLIDAGNLIGQLPGNLIDWVPIGSLVQINQNYLTDPDFAHGENIDGKGQWFYDAVQGYAEPGCVYTSADGTTKALLQKGKTATTKNNQITVGARIKWSALAVSGVAGPRFAIDVVFYKGDTYVRTQRVAHLDIVGTASDWTYITGNYTVTDNVGDVDGYRVRLVVESTVTAGLVYWDNVISQKTQLIALDWVDGATDWLTDLNNQIQAMLQSWTTALGGTWNPGGDFNSWLTSVEDYVNDLFNDAQDANAAAQDAWDNSELGIALANASQTFANQVDAARVAGEAWLKNFFEDATILWDIFHTSYPVGHSTDSPTTTEFFNGSNKRTYWAAWNRQMLGNQWAATTPSNPTPPVPVLPSPAAAVVNKFSAVNTAIVQGASGTMLPSGTMVTEADSQAAVQTLRDTVADVQTTVAQIQTDQTDNGGVKVTVNAQGDNNDWGPAWTLSGPGTVDTGTGHSFEWTTQSSGQTVDKSVKGIFNAQASLTDLQVVSIIFKTSVQQYLGADGPSNKILARCNLAGTEYIYADVFNSHIKLGYAVGGVEQTPWQTATATVGAGAVVSLWTGVDAANLRHYLVYVGNTKVIDYIETGTSSVLGTLNRYSGQIMFAKAGVFGDQYGPASIINFTLKDQGGATATFGSTARWSRRTAGPTGVSFPRDTAVHGWGSTVLDTKDYASPDITLTASGIGFYNAGVYRITFSLFFSTAQSAVCTAGVIRSTSGGGSVEAINPYETITAQGIHGSFMVQVGGASVAEFIQPAATVQGSGTLTIIGDGGGNGTWLEVERVA